LLKSGSAIEQEPIERLIINRLIPIYRFNRTIDRRIKKINVVINKGLTQRLTGNILSRTAHDLYIGTMVVIVLTVSIYLAQIGYSYYKLPIEERFYHPNHDWFKPSGYYGHGLGIIGTAMMAFGVFIYIARKRYNFLSRYIRLKYLLEFHIFLCTLGPILIVFHTSFKLGGIVSVAFWSMVAVVFSGVIGRFIYIQIPRSIEGRELSLNEIKGMRNDLITALKSNSNIEPLTLEWILDDGNKDFSNRTLFYQFIEERREVLKISKKINNLQISRADKRGIIALVNHEIKLSNKIKRLASMQQIFKYWHVAHLPFALIMLVIVLIHVIVTFAFGYKWIF
jgi:hypothetical protein